MIENIQIPEGMEKEAWEEALTCLHTYCTPKKIHSFKLQVNFVREIGHRRKSNA
jgi:hypothetical protein